jgi:hypothetical protein
MSVIPNGKTYWEIIIAAQGDAYRFEYGLVSTAYLGTAIGASTPAGSWQQNSGNTAGNFYVNGSSVYSTSNANSVNDVFMFAYDDSTNRVWVGKNGTWFNSGAPSSGTGYLGTLTSGNTYFPAVNLNTASTANAIYINNGAGSGFSYTPPTGFVALNTYNL